MRSDGSRGTNRACFAHAPKLLARIKVLEAERNEAEARLLRALEELGAPKER